MRHSPAALVGGTIVLFFVFIAGFAPFLAPSDPTRGNLADSYLLAPPLCTTPEQVDKIVEIVRESAIETVAWARRQKAEI